MPVSIAKERSEHRPAKAAQANHLHVHLQAFVDRRRDPDSKREAVLHIAVRMFLERGFWRTSLSDVAEKLKITKPALYHYFHNKEEIYLECYRRGISLIQANLDRLRAHGGNGLEKVVGFIYTYAVVIASDFGRCVVRQDDRELSQEARAEVRSYKRQVDRCLRSFIEEGVKDGTIRSCNVKLAAFSIAGAVNSLALWFEPGGDLTAEQVAAGFAKTLTEGVANRRTGKLRLPDFGQDYPPPFQLIGQQRVQVSGGLERET
jgi:AcrR family transcriptional regulator